MFNAKEKMTEIIQSPPEDATYEEIMRELAFERMVARGLEDSRQGWVVSNDEMEQRIRSWQHDFLKKLIVKREGIYGLVV